MQTFAEHTKSVSSVKWNPNNQDQFASVSADGLLKVWDRRSGDSIATMTDRLEMPALLSCDWHKQDVRLCLGGGVSVNPAC
jgi:WD40 repeat protein